MEGTIKSDADGKGKMRCGWREKMDWLGWKSAAIWWTDPYRWVRSESTDESGFFKSFYFYYLFLIDLPRHINFKTPLLGWGLYANTIQGKETYDKSNASSYTVYSSRLFQLYVWFDEEETRVGAKGERRGLNCKKILNLKGLNAEGRWWVLEGEGEVSKASLLPYR